VIPYCPGTHEARLMSMLSGCPRSAQDLASNLHTDPRSVRADIAHLICDHHVPICSTPADGFWLARSWSDIDRTVANLRSRQLEIQKRIDGLVQGGRETIGPQMVLDFEEAV